MPKSAPKRKPVTPEEVIDMIYIFILKFGKDITKENVMELFDDDSHLKDEINAAFTLAMTRGIEYKGAIVKLSPTFRKNEDDHYKYEVK